MTQEKATNHKRDHLSLLLHQLAFVGKKKNQKTDRKNLFTKKLEIHTCPRQRWSKQIPIKKKKKKTSALLMLRSEKVK